MDDDCCSSNNKLEWYRSWHTFLSCISLRGLPLLKLSNDSIRQCLEKALNMVREGGQTRYSSSFVGREVLEKDECAFLHGRERRGRAMRCGKRVRNEGREMEKASQSPGISASLS